MDAFCAGEKNAYTTLDASGLSVGLPAGLMGNSEVGHLNIGAGRVVYQVKPLLEYYACKNLLYIVRAHLDVHSLTLVWSKWNVIKPNWKAASPWQAIYSTCSWPFVDAASFKAMILEVVLGFERSFPLQCNSLSLPPWCDVLKQESNCFSQVGKTCWTELLYRKNILPGSKTGKISPPSTWPLI